MSTLTTLAQARESAAPTLASCEDADAVFIRMAWGIVSVHRDGHCDGWTIAEAQALGLW